MKKLLSAALAVLMIAAALAAAIPALSKTDFPFSDVAEGDWYRDPVAFVYGEGLMVGVSGTTFAPDAPMTRAMFVTVLCRLSGETASAADAFSDVPASEWYARAVGWAASAGIVEGYPDGTFRPDGLITREEAAATVVRYNDYAELRMPKHSATAPKEFADGGEIAEWAETDVDALRLAGVFKGDENVNFNPMAYLTRAEAATVIYNYVTVTGRMWNGYVPDAGSDAIVYGAAYLYWNGFIIQGKLGEDLVTDGEYPYLEVYPDDTYSYNDHIAYNGEHSVSPKSYEPFDTFGISVTNQLADLTRTPYVKICYEYTDGGPEALFPAYLSNRSGRDDYRTTPVSFGCGDDDAGFSTAICDTTAAVASFGVSFGADTGDNVHVMIRPFEGASDGAGFRVRYIALFATREAAEAYSCGEHADFLKNYHPDEYVSTEKVDDATVESYLSIIREKIREIKESPSSFTPDDVPEGATVWYVSSIHGDKNNDGHSPETPLSSPEDLYRKRGPVYFSKVEEGDYVFFERGSVFYPWRYYEHIIATLTTTANSYYGAYGDPALPKPVFKGSFDFGGGCGDWQATEWEDIYVLDLLPLVPENKENFAGADGDIGKIIFNGGQYLGVRVFPDEESELDEEPKDPFGEGKTTRLMYEMGNCDEYFISGGTTALNPGDALRHNLEYIHDRNACKVYLRCKWGNPADVFESVDLCRKANVGWLSDGGHYDNLCFLYSSYICADIGNNSVVTYCEAGYGGGYLGSVGTGIGGYGECERLEIDHCYIHDIEDGPMGTQETGGIPGINLCGVILTNNVVTTSQNLVELFNDNIIEGEDGLGMNKIIGARVSGNYGAYIGYGYPRTVCQVAEGLVLHNWYYGELVDCEFWNNTLVCCEGSVIGADVASDGNPRGWRMHDNTYVLNPEICYILRGTDGTLFKNLNKRFIAGYKMPYTDRYLSYLVSNGIEYGSKFYEYDGISEGEANRYFVTTGYYVERGIRPR